MAELVDAHVSGACVERHAGSSPVLGTTHEVFVSGGMAELVDAIDSKSIFPKESIGSTPITSTNKILNSSFLVRVLF